MNESLEELFLPQNFESFPTPVEQTEILESKEPSQTTEVPFSYNGKEVTLQIPTNEAAEDFFSVDLKNGRSSRHLNEQGRELAASNWEALQSTLESDPTIEGLSEAIQEFFAHSKERTDLSPEQQTYLGLFKRSLDARLRRLTQEAHYQELEATNPVTQAFTEKVRSFFPGHTSEAFTANMLLPVYSSLKKDIDAALRTAEVPENKRANHSLLLETKLLADLTEKLEVLQVEELPEKAPLNHIILSALHEMGLVGATRTECLQEYASKNLASLSELLETSTVTSITSNDLEQILEATHPIEPPKTTETPAEQKPVLSHRKRWSPKIGARLGAAALLLQNVFSVQQAAEMYVPSPTLVAFNHSGQNQVETTKLQELNRTPELTERTHLEEDPNFIYPGSVLHTVDILRRIQQLTDSLEEAKTHNSPQLSQKCGATIHFLADALEQYPQAQKFEVAVEGNNLELTPLDWQDQVEVKETVKTDLVIVGGELNAVTDAMEAAHNNKKVTLIYSTGGLGGVCNDTIGGNMRYADSPSGSPQTTVQHELYSKALGMQADTAMPTNVHHRIREYLEQNYPTITLVPANLNTLHVGKIGETISSITVPEHQVTFLPTNVIDADPEHRIANKAGLTTIIETPNISYDVTGVNQATLSNRGLTGVQPEEIKQWAGISQEDVTHNPELEQELAAYSSRQGAEFYSPNTHASYGFNNISQAFQVYMLAKEAKSSGAERIDLHNLNNRRQPTGFNIAFHEDGSATFNGLSYNFGTDQDKAIVQDDHNLHTDERFESLRTVEVEGFQEFLSHLAEKPVTVHMPRQLYVRGGSVIKTMRPLHRKEFHSTPTNAPMTIGYTNDTRGMQPRSDHDSLYHAVKNGYPAGPMYWKAKAEHTFVAEYSNLFINSKAAANPETMGAERILQHQIDTGVDLVQQLSNGSFAQNYVATRANHKPFSKHSPNPTRFMASADYRPTVILANHKVRIETPLSSS
jgi:hypothetical protein